MEKENPAFSVFKDLLVIELASVLAGPSVGLFFVECGAKVIKIENKKTGGDVTRTWLNKSENNQNISAYYASVNQGKEIVMLDLDSNTDIEILEQYLQKADIVLSNFKEQSAVRWNLSPKQLIQRFPKLLIGQIDAFQENNSRVAFDIVLQAEAGYLSMTGDKNSPARLPVAFIDILAGHQLKEGLLLGLINKLKTGKGCIVRVNLLESAIGALANQASNYLMSHVIPEAQGTLHPNIAPYGEWFLCKDEKGIILAIGNDHQFQNLLTCLELVSLNSDVRFNSNPNRVKNRKALSEIFLPVFKLKERAYWTSKFHAMQIPCGSILNLEEVFEQNSTQVNEVIIENTLTRAVKTVNFNIEY